MAEAAQKTRYTAGPLTFVVRHELWDGNIQDHADQGVMIPVMADVGGKDDDAAAVQLLRLREELRLRPGKCGPACSKGQRCSAARPRRTSTAWTRPPTATRSAGRSGRSGTKLPKMLERAGYPQIAEIDRYGGGDGVLPDVEACARELYATKRNTVKHNRGTHIFEAGNIRFGLEMRRLAMGDGGLAIHVLADIGGTPGKKYTEETELLAFDHFLERRALPLRPAQQEPSHLLGHDPDRGSARLDAGAVRERASCRR